MSQVKVELTNDEHKSLIEHPLTSFQNIENTAITKYSSAFLSETDSVINKNGFADKVNTVLQCQSKNNEEKKSSYRKIAEKPAISKVKVLYCNSREKREHYVSPCTGLGQVTDCTHISKDSPVGLMVNYGVGYEKKVPSGESVVLLENSTYNTHKSNGKWDSYNTFIKSEKYRSGIEIPSLQAEHQKATITTTQKDISIIETKISNQEVYVGRKKENLKEEVLSYRSILDEKQADLFQLPLRSQIFLEGPAGSGKTTTMFRRITNKLNLEYFPTGEKELLESLEIDHQEAWIVFVPTELLKNYLEDSFYRENEFDNLNHFRTWDSMREQLCKELEFKVGKKAGELVDDKEVFDFFAEIHDQLCMDSINGAYEKIKKTYQFFADYKPYNAKHSQIILEEDKEALLFVEEIVKVLEKIKNYPIDSVMIELSRVIKEIQILEENISKKRNEYLENIVSAQYPHFLSNQNTTIFKKIYKKDFSEKARKTKFYNAIRWLANGKSANTPEAKKHALLLQKMPISLTEYDVSLLSEANMLVDILKKLASFTRRYFRTLGDNYRTFRNELGLGEDTRTLSQQEADIVLLVALETMQKLLQRTEVQSNLQESYWGTLKKISSFLYTQVLVDEVTDFSPIQVRCMSKLCHPKVKSLFMCGDLAQRLTQEGMKSTDDFDWALGSNKWERHNIGVGYRQCKGINDFANKLVEQGNIDGSNMEVPEDYHNNEGVYPILLENAALEKQAKWIQDRIAEIYKEQKDVTIAIITPQECEAEGLYALMKRPFEKKNISIQLCTDGQSTGSKEQVRIFSLEHIKGLEFEAIFFIGLDELEEAQPALFTRYLYVAATRAARFLGITCYNSLPKNLETIRPMLKDNWTEYK